MVTKGKHMGRRGLARELIEELNTVLRGKQTTLDTVVPPVLFVVVNLISGLDAAAVAALASAVLIMLFRLLKRQSLTYAVGGVGGVLLAVSIAKLAGSAEGYFVPALISGGLTVLACLGSVIIHRPLVALTSRLTRGWPMAWYWHPKVRPAYSEVTIAWAVFFAIRLGLQAALLDRHDATLLAAFNILSGWPATIILLIASYIYGQWRLEQLHGPSIEEFKLNAPPPWQGQKRGF
jgi:intracellular septation protein A